MPEVRSPSASCSSRPASRWSPSSASRSKSAANVGFFSVVNSVFLRRLPYREPDRLVRFSSTNEAQNLTRIAFAYSRMLALYERTTDMGATSHLLQRAAVTLRTRGLRDTVLIT